MGSNLYRWSRKVQGASTCQVNINEKKDSYKTSEHIENKSKKTLYIIKISLAFLKNRIKVNIAGLQTVEGKLWEMIICKICAIFIMLTCLTVLKYSNFKTSWCPAKKIRFSQLYGNHQRGKYTLVNGILDHDLCQSNQQLKSPALHVEKTHDKHYQCV